MTAQLAPHRSRLAVVAALALLVAFTPAAVRSASAGAPPLSCSGAFAIDETLPNGARWQMCWEERQREGIILRDITYTPPGHDPVLVLAEASIAQIHVPYDDNGARFHDVSDYGMGGGNLNDLVAGDCPDGDLINAAGQNVLCSTVGNEGYAYKYYEEQAQATSLTLFSVSHIGAYNYVPAWNFDDDGTIRPEMGATGQLQRYGGSTSTGWNVGGGNVAVAHMHNFYWRLDFDVDGTANDRAQELQATFSANRTSISNVRTPFYSEAARRVAPSNMRTWRVYDLVTANEDGNRISWEVLPNTDNIFRGPSYEGFTQNEMYITQYQTCERFASHNLGCSPARGSLNNYVNGESLVGGDVVLWYGTSFHHLPRDEDEPHMHPHWSGFSIVPRGVTAENPAG